MSANRHLAPGFDTKLLKNFFAELTDAVGALIFTVKSNKFPPTVNLVFSFSSFYDFNLHAIFLYVTFYLLGLVFLKLK